MTIDDLLRYAPLFQVIAYTSLTFTTVMVATAAVIFTYRNNFGWKPLCIVLSHGAGTPPGKHYIDATLRFEIWNRHKYPIALREMKIEYPFYWLTEEQTQEWVPTGYGEVTRLLEEILPPTTHKEFQTAVTHDRDKARKTKKPYVRLTLIYFDPRRNKGKLVVVKQSLSIQWFRARWWRWLSPTYSMNRWRGRSGADF